MYNVICLRKEQRYFQLKGKAMILASKIGLYESDYLKIMKQFVPPGSEAIDVGANFGVYTYHLSRLVGSKGKVYSFEPLPFVFSILKKTFGNQNNVQLFEEALSNQNQAVCDITIPYLPGGYLEPALATLYSRPASNQKKIVQVQLKKLDHYFGSFRKLSFIKVDIEGHELEFLEGAAEVIKTFHPVIQLEADKIGPFEDQLFFWARSFNYQIYNLTDQKLSPAKGTLSFSNNIYLIPNQFRKLL
jgi:FkbM family methyltransferase